MKVLVVEDELKMASLLLRGFRNNGHAADVTRSGDPAGLARNDRDRADGQGVRVARGVHAPARRGSLPWPAARTGMGHGLRQPLERDRRLRQLPARQDRPPVRGELARDRPRSRLQAAPRRQMSRLPIRIRLTLAFTLVIAVVLAATGLFL